MADSSMKSEVEDAPSITARERLAASDLIEATFLFTMDKQNDKAFVLLPELLESTDGQDWLDFDILSMALFERLLMEKPSSFVLPAPARSVQGAADPHAFTYMYHCYLRGYKQKNKEYAEKCQQVIIELASTSLQEPDLYQGQNISNQMCDIFFQEFFSADGDTMQNFMEQIFSKIDEETSGSGQLYNTVLPILQRIHGSFLRGMLGKICADSQASNGLKQLHFFTRLPNLAEALLRFTTPAQQSAILFEKTLLGAALSSSCAPNVHGDGGNLFPTPSRMSQSDIQRVESTIHMNTEMVVSSLHELFVCMARLSPNMKHLLLTWIGNVLSVNQGRVKLASTMSIHNDRSRGECTDGFMLNLCSVLLKLCLPFCKPQGPKLLKIHPCYCRDRSKDDETRKQKQHHATGLSEETFLVPLEENEVNSLIFPTEYGFICELYFLTQQTMYLGFHATYERFMNLNRELSRMQDVYQQMQASGNTDEAFKHIFEMSMKRYLATKAALTDPQLLRSSMQFHISSATLLTHIATGGNLATNFKPLHLPTASCNKLDLGCMPEFTLTNITDAMELMRRFKDSFFQECLEFADHIMNLILVFMGNRNRVKNPHLRAKLASVLHELMPKTEGGTAASHMNDFLKERLFTHHPNIKSLASTLFNVFVSIETTGESVEFEQKLSYRQPMYRVIDYIWKIQVHKDSIKDLTDYALLHIDDTDPPLFLKFTNLLINDANFLLDEALDFMRQIREKQEENEQRSAPLTGRALQQFEADQNQMGMLARFHNTAAVDTTNTLALLSTQCSELFCHSVMVDRIAAMLNYFLLQLTGPKMKAFKVKNFDKYEFKPSEIVSNICKIYLNLGSAEAFCQAVSADGRSYTSELLPRAELVLQKIHSPVDMLQSFTELIQKIEGSSLQHLADEDFMNSAPDEYLDAIMGTVMRDPVTLPNSGQIVDRSTIARHILSDQTDPFNRSPLTLDQVIPNQELKEAIEKWMSSKKQ